MHFHVWIYYPIAVPLLIERAGTSLPSHTTPSLAYIAWFDRLPYIHVQLNVTVLLI